MKKILRELLSDDLGHLSTMRVIVAMGAGNGTGLLIVGVVALFMKFDHVPVLLTTGAGLVTTAMGAKWLQKKVENK
jgi:hypothetical protein